ncbi:aldose epimerase family protein [Sediminitomix flava]|uniref:Aldose 1-epimerase n=1 Tax=Sediminitomix flava TaxID=379075 RepID=A0A315Z707_SEDFL|nr:aldose epimerase family protein [Sediminitomix flava]PWJ39321.1 aldose 1-epimerase [Sediminitomix flava]
MLTIHKQSWGTLDDGRVVSLYTLKNNLGTQIALSDFGAMIASIKTNDADGMNDEITLNHESFYAYYHNGEHPFLGGTIGRFAGKINEGKFRIGDKEYALAQNQAPNHLNGGVEGFDRKLWTGTRIRENDRVGVRFTFVAKHLEEGYPGNLQVNTTYYLNDKNELRIDFEAVSDEDTHVNITNHTYYNLKGAKSGNCLDHQIRLYADRFLHLNENHIPSGELMPVSGSPMDFTSEKVLGKHIDTDYEQVKLTSGFDHDWVLNSAEKEVLKHAASVYEPNSRRTLDVYTTYPSVHLYTGNSLHNFENTQGNTFEKHAGLALEAQYYPDSPNHSHFPSTLLEKGRLYSEKTILKFGIR